MIAITFWPVPYQLIPWRGPPKLVVRAGLFVFMNATDLIKNLKDSIKAKIRHKQSLVDEMNAQIITLRDVLGEVEDIESQEAKAHPNYPQQPP